MRLSDLLSRIVWALVRLRDFLWRIISVRSTFDPSSDPEFQTVVKRQNKVINKLRRKGVRDQLFEQLIEQSWSGPDDDAWVEQERGRRLGAE